MTPADIEGAVCNSPRHCAIARTIYRQLDLEIGRVRVTTAGVSIAHDGYRHYYKVPRKACVLVCDFDAGKEVKPISFTLLLADRRKITAVPEDRKRQINEARRQREVAAIAAGEAPKIYHKGRYGI